MLWRAPLPVVRLLHMAASVRQNGGNVGQAAQKERAPRPHSSSSAAQSAHRPRRRKSKTRLNEPSP
jgi:hypothetical protein